MKVLLINPPDTGMMQANLPAYVDQERGYLPPLGLLQVASYAKARTNWEVRVYDSNVESRELGDLIYDYKPDLVGITATTFTLISALKIAKRVKNFSNYTKVVLGGVHTSIYPEESSRLPYIDYIVAGEGEEPFVKLLEDISKARENGHIYQSRGLIPELDNLPIPDRTMTDYKAYSSILGSKGYITTMMTSRGCPYHCIFCHRPHLGKVFRARSTENVLEELEQIVGLGIGEVLIYDDTFTVDLERAKAICLGIIQRHLPIVYDIRARVDTVDSELMELLKASGCKRIHYGIEATNPSVLKAICKEICLERVEETFALTKKYGIETLAYFIFGSPTETEVDILHTIEYAKRLQPDYCHFAVMTPYPATPLYQLGLNRGMYSDYWQEFAREPREDFVPPCWNEIEQERLRKLLNKAYKSFYLRPWYILKQARKAYREKSLGRIVKAGTKVLLKT